MIAEPVNDVSCLSKVTQAADDAVDTAAVRNTAARFGTMRALAAWIRTLFQASFTPEWGRDETGRRKIWRASGEACFPAAQLALRPGKPPDLRFGGDNSAKSGPDQLKERPQRFTADVGPRFRFDFALLRSGRTLRL